MSQYTGFIAENTAPEGAKRIGIYDANGNRAGQIPLGNLSMNKGELLYRFGAVSDVHLSRETAEADFRRALGYFQNETEADFVCISGDITEGNGDYQWTAYNDIKNEFAVRIYPIGGNHDTYNAGMTKARFLEKTGFHTFYTVSQGNDVLLFITQTADANENGIYAAEDLQALMDALETNRNKRCFVFVHSFIRGGSGDPLNLYTAGTFGGNEEAMKSLMRHYKNAIWFHGHSHHMFQGQEVHGKANYDHDFGVHSVHIPSLTVPIDISTGQRVTLSEGSQGYLIDVYENGIHLRGRDFVNGVYPAIASYWLDTPLREISAGTYSDETGSIATASEPV